MDVPTNQTHTSYVLGPGPGGGGDCSCPPVVIQQGRQTWSPCQAGHSPGVRKQQRGALSLPRRTKARVAHALLLDAHLCLPGLHFQGPAALTLNLASFRSCFVTTVTCLRLPYSVSSLPSLHAPR